MKNEIKLSDGKKKSESKELDFKMYTQPKIIKLGVIQSVTLGGSIGVGDSCGGCDPANEKPFT